MKNEAFGYKICCMEKLFSFLKIKLFFVVKLNRLPLSVKDAGNAAACDSKNKNQASIFPNFLADEERRTEQMRGDLSNRGKEVDENSKYFDQNSR